jgi:2-methylcitrate dehydratase PrpD
MPLMSMISTQTTPGFEMLDPPQFHSISEHLAAFTTSLSLSEIPSPVIHHAKLHILDTLGVGLAASSFDFAKTALAGIQCLGESGQIPVIGFPVTLSVRDAALLTGTLIHGLDFDDTHLASIVHPSASALAAVLSAGTAHHASGGEALLAYLAAVETVTRLGCAVAGDFHRVGLHPTGLLGAFSCVLAIGRVARLNAKQMTDAQGIVLSMAGGSLEFLEEGTWTKRLHPGWAAVCALTATALASQGFAGPRLAYEGRFGLYRMHLGAEAAVDWHACTKALGSEWEMLRVRFKPYPACHFTHAFIDAALKLAQDHHILPAHIDSITARIAAGEVATVCEPQPSKRRPRNAYEAQFSVHYAIAASLLRQRFTLSELTPECLTDPTILALCDRTHYEIDPDAPFPQQYAGDIVVTMHDGKQLRQTELGQDALAGALLSEERTIAKFEKNASLALDPPAVRRILDRVMRLDELPDVALLMEALSTEG